MLTSTRERSEYITVVVSLRSPPDDARALVSPWVERILPNVSVTRVKCTAFHRGRGQIPISTNCISQLQDPRVRDAASIIAVAFDRTRRHDKLDYASYFEYEVDPIVCGRTIPPHLLLAVRVSSMAGPERTGRSPRLGPLSLATCVVPLMEEIGGIGPVSHGLIEVSDCWDSGFGRVHGLCRIGYAPFQRQLARQVWVEDGDPVKVCGVFWANWLGAEQLARLGPSFVADYRALEDPLDNPLVRVQPDGSVLAMLTREPEDMLFPYHRLAPNALSRASWLFREFSKARLLPGT